jgi:hypothetical protein
MGFYRGAQIVRDGLVLCLDAGSERSYPKSGTVWKDLSGNGNNGTLVNGPTFDSGSITFDGVNDQVTITHNNILNINDNITIEFWFYSQNYKNPEDYAINFVGKYNGTSTANFLFYYGGTFLNNKLQVYSNTNGTWKAASPLSQILNLNQWYHVVWTYNNGGLLYINGISQGNTTASGVLATNTQPIRIGSELVGNISLFKIYNRALLPQEIQQNYTATKSRFGL